MLAAGWFWLTMAKIFPPFQQRIFSDPDNQFN